MSNSYKPEEWVAVARLLRPRGNRGELAALSLTGRPERFRRLRAVMLFGGAGFPGEAKAFEVEDFWEHDGRPVFKFAGIDSISEAEALREAEVQVRVGERIELEPGEYFQSDLTGCGVIEFGSGRNLGLVTNFLELGGKGVLEVRGAAGREVLIPFTREICREIDIEARRIAVELPPGLEDLNAR